MGTVGGLEVRASWDLARHLIPLVGNFRRQCKMSLQEDDRGSGQNSRTKYLELGCLEGEIIENWGGNDGDNMLF